MTYQIKNTISGKAVRNAVSGKVMIFDDKEAAQQAMSNLAALLRADCKKPFRFIVVAAQSG